MGSFGLQVLVQNLSTCQDAVDRAICGDVSVIRSEFETRQVYRMIWFPGKINSADPLTKKDSTMSRTLEMILYSGTIPINFHQALCNRSDKSDGLENIQRRVNMEINDLSRQLNERKCVRRPMLQHITHRLRIRDGNLTEYLRFAGSSQFSCDYYIN